MLVSIRSKYLDLKIIMRFNVTNGVTLRLGKMNLEFNIAVHVLCFLAQHDKNNSIVN